MNFSTLLSLTKFIVNFNDGQVDQDISDERLKQVLNLCYKNEVNKAKQEGGRRWFREYMDVTWSADAVTLALPDSVNRAEIIVIRDVTNDTPGGRILFSEEGFSGDVFWKDRRTLQWGNTGPSSEKTLRFFYFARPVDMVDEEDEPDLLPDDHHEVLAWSAACKLRAVGDEEAPLQWLRMLDDLRLDMHKVMSKGRPQDDVPWIDQSEADMQTGDLF